MIYKEKRNIEVLGLKACKTLKKQVIINKKYCGEKINNIANGCFNSLFNAKKLLCARARC